MAPPKATRWASATDFDDDHIAQRPTKKAKKSQKYDAASKALGLVELLESVLKHVSPATLLRAKAVSKRWQEVIETSPSIAQSMPSFFLDLSTAKFSYKLSKFGQHYQPPLPHQGRRLPSISLSPRYRGMYSPLLEKHSLRHLQLSQPPTTKLTARYFCFCGDYHVNEKRGSNNVMITIENDQGITFGQVVREVEYSCRLTCRRRWHSQGRVARITMVMSEPAAMFAQLGN